MIRHWHVALAVLVVAASLVGGLILVVRAQSVQGAVAWPAISVPPNLPGPTTPGPTSAPTPVPTSGPSTAAPGPRTESPGPPAGTAHVDDRYRARYGGRYVGWNNLLARGRKLPEVSARCRSAWRATTRDDGLNWKKGGYLCLDRLTGNGFKPQGVGGSGSTEGYRIGEGAAGERNIVMVTSYSSVEEKGLLFPHDPGRTVTTRLTVIDIDHRRYNTVELVKPSGPSAFTALDSHGSGFAWVGQYMYSSSRGSLWMYNADDLMQIDDHYVLPAVARWNVNGEGGLSSIGIDRSTHTRTLTGINYSENGTAWSQSFQLDANGRLRHGSTKAAHELSLSSVFGSGPTSVRSTRSAVVEGTNFQGIGTSGRYRLINSSSLLLDGRRHGDNVVILKKNKMIARFVLPRENVESLYVDYTRSRYVTVTEHGRQFLFWLPLDHLIDRAER